MLSFLGRAFPPSVVRFSPRMLSGAAAVTVPMPPGLVVDTPLLESAPLSALVGTQVLLCTDSRVHLVLGCRCVLGQCGCPEAWCTVT